MNVTAEDLKQKKCVSCEGNEKPMDRGEAENYLAETHHWTLEDNGKKIARETKNSSKYFVIRHELVIG